ncbi:hypothetical protein E4U30_007304 [Claviceps sp. LM220 group G6]|nr:hypothetical protein E4U15_007014 [Claviceps sp. LM218 group G6]KAG6091229.1 hypothetical protein E4U31_007303 [Claviceps sp. LM219 group G6]KAG6091276.1 hypothetical protein E4U30_007304 [Claviceps sp. LM220 group G6]
MASNLTSPGMMAGTSTVSSSIVFPPSPPSTVSKSRKNSTDCISNDVSTLSPSIAEQEDYPPYPLAPLSNPRSVLQEDLKTPDRHVERDGRLIRLTGMHPFNCEPPLSDLFREGFLTSENLHYVRNHGPVPRCDDEYVDGWTFTVEGLVEYPFVLSVRELIDEYEQLTYPVTLVCAGNRRKEQNVVRKSKGFSWGPGGVSTALWTGVMLRDLLSRAKPHRGARFVCFEGAETLPNGCYETSIKLNWCLDPNKGILIAHKMNGNPLHPDHGKPVRVIVPGQIGGRSVKWLKRIIVTESPSNNWYHIYDNRLLPTMVTPEASVDLPDTWKDERYAIYDLNTNSVICLPAHEETISLAVDGPSSYKVQGYAYSGGGKRISRMEVTLDQGKTWRLAAVDYPEDRYRLAANGQNLYGGKIDMWWRETSFCWCFWEIDIVIEELKAAKDIIARGMDESLMVQPREMYWSVLGMMNNPWFRVAIHNQGYALQFEHPTQPASKPGGWMERVRKTSGSFWNGAWESEVRGQAEETVTGKDEMQTCMTNSQVDRLITSQEIKQQMDEDSPWFIINNQVYDGRPFLEDHPGGAASISGAAGQDVTEEFIAIHSENAKAMMPQYHIGRLDHSALAELVKDDDTRYETNRTVFLDTSQWIQAHLLEKTPVSPDSKIFRFKLDHENQTLGLPTGQHVMMRIRDSRGRAPIIRAYTPISDGEQKGWLDLLIKIYPNTLEQEGGKMTQALDSVPIAGSVEFKGPVGKFEYLGNGYCSCSGKKRRVSRFIMICGGSGITPMLQVVRAVARDTDDLTQCLLLDGNRGEEDILCRRQLDEMVSRAPQKVRLVHCLSQPPPSWQGRIGRINQDLIAAEAGRKRSGTEDLVLLCGPPSMVSSVRSIMIDLGWNSKDIEIF